ncbi:hypothetical protein [Corallococcus exercitus]|uniref:hypothetical protein n=1 Tax=Corallococcus exercitus TaxID=2316736 RepID=UPI0035D47424
MSRMRVFAIVIAVLLAGTAVAVVVLRGRTVEGQDLASELDDDDFASSLEERPKCWVKVKSSAPGKCPGDAGRVYKGECYMANWAGCASYY